MVVMDFDDGHLKQNHHCQLRLPREAFVGSSTFDDLHFALKVSSAIAPIISMRTYVLVILSHDRHVQVLAVKRCWQPIALGLLVQS